MSDQLALEGTGVPTPPDVRLTERQRYALELVAVEEPIPSALLGAYLHERKLRNRGLGHSSDRRCQFCEEEGKSVGRRLRELGLVRFSRKHDGWYLAATSAKKVAEIVRRRTRAPLPTDLPEGY